MRPDAWLFGESQARMLVSVSRQHAGPVRDLAADAEVPVATIGEVSPGVLEFGELATIPVVELKGLWEGTLRGVLEAGGKE
jgi:phosphoribosylformylglycinamidine synthase